MKIISGNLKGRVVKGYNLEGTRPTMDRVKESVFAIIQNKIKDSIVLDLFSGSGNLGIEAISNGAKLSYFNDINKECVKTIKENIATFKIENSSVILNKTWIEALQTFKVKNTKFDLIFLDPPYKMECLNEVIDKIIEYKLLNNKGLIICEISTNYLKDWETLERIKDKKYGDKIVVILKNK